MSAANPRNGQGAEIQIRYMSLMKGIAKYAVVDMSEPSVVYRSERFHALEPIAPFGQTFRVVATNSPTWSSDVQIEYPTQADVITRVLLRSQLPALTKAAIGGVAFDVFYTRNVGAAAISRLEFEPKGGHVTEVLDAHTIEIYNQLFVPEDQQMKQAAHDSEDVADLIQWSSAASDVWTVMPLFHGRLNHRGYNVAGTLSTPPALHVTFASQAQCSQSIPEAGNAVYGGTTPWATNAATFQFWFLCITVSEREAQDLTMPQYMTFKHFVTPRSFAVSSVATAATSAVSIEFPTKAPVEFIACAFTNTTRHDTHHDRFNYQGAGTNAIPIDPITEMSVQTDGSEYTAVHPAIFYREVMPALFAARVPNRFIYLIPFATKLGDEDNIRGYLPTHFVNRMNLNLTFQGHPTNAAAGVAGDGALGAGLLRVVAMTYNVAQIDKSTFSTMYQV